MSPFLTFRSLCSLCGLLSLVSLSLSASAQDQGQGIIQMQENQMGNDERAKAHFRVGQSLYDAGRFNEAAEEWEKAFELSQRSELLYNVYVAYRDAASSTDKAIGALRRYLQLGQIEATRRLQLEARLARGKSPTRNTPRRRTRLCTEAAPSTSATVRPIPRRDTSTDRAVVPALPTLRCDRAHFCRVGDHRLMATASNRTGRQLANDRVLRGDLRLTVQGQHFLATTPQDHRLVAGCGGRC